MEYSLRWKITCLLIDGCFEEAISIGRPYEFKHIAKVAVEKGLIQEAEACAEKMDRRLTYEELTKIKTKALEKCWIYTFLKCKEKLRQPVNEEECRIMLKQCIERGWLNEATMFARIENRELNLQELLEILEKCITLKYWYYAKKCAKQLPGPRQIEELARISKLHSPEELISNYKHKRKLPKKSLKTTIW